MPRGVPKPKDDRPTPPCSCSAPHPKAPNVHCSCSTKCAPGQTLCGACQSGRHVY